MNLVMTEAGEWRCCLTRFCNRSYWGGKIINFSVGMREIVVTGDVLARPDPLWKQSRDKSLQIIGQQMSEVVLPPPFPTCCKVKRNPFGVCMTLVWFPNACSSKRYMSPKSNLSLGPPIAPQLQMQDTNVTKTLPFQLARSLRHRFSCWFSHPLLLQQRPPRTLRLL